MSKLYEIGERYRNLEALLDDDSIPSDMILEAAVKVEEEFTTKAQGIGCLAINMAAEIKAYKEEEDRLAQRRKTMQAKLDGLKGYLLKQMQDSGLRNIKGVIPLRIQTNSRGSVIVDDETAIPTQYYVILDPQLDKESLYKNIKAGEEVPGCHIETGEHLRIG